MKTFDSEAGGALQTNFEALVRDWEAVTAQTMFGHPSYKAGGTIFALLRTDSVVLTRLPDEERERLGHKRDVGPFQAGDQTIETWVDVPIGAEDLDGISQYVRASHDAALRESRTVPTPDHEE
jgi:hypothetical protein